MTDDLSGALHAHADDMTNRAEDLEANPPPAPVPGSAAASEQSLAAQHPNFLRLLASEFRRLADALPGRGGQAGHGTGQPGAAGYAGPDYTASQSGQPVPPDYVADDQPAEGTVTAGGATTGRDPAAE
jgi:hypothetical protein